MSDGDGVFPDVQDAVVEPTGCPDGEDVVLEWRRRGEVWEGLVRYEVDGRIRTEWRPALVMSRASPADSAADDETGPRGQGTT